MRKIVVGLFISLDGVTQGPGPMDEFEHAGWTMPYFNDEVGAFIGEQTFASDALLLGRKTYEGFKAAFGGRTGPDADGMNAMQKYVVSSTLTSADWTNTTLISGNTIEEIKKLKQQPGKDIAISGSVTLVQNLLKHGLVDQLSLLVYPVALGTGARLFENGVPMTNLTLIEARPLSNGVVTLKYQVEPNA